MPTPSAPVSMATRSGLKSVATPGYGSVATSAATQPAVRGGPQALGPHGR